MHSFRKCFRRVRLNQRGAVDAKSAVLLQKLTWCIKRRSAGHTCVCARVCVMMCSDFELTAPVLCNCVSGKVLVNKSSTLCPTHSSRAVLFFVPYGTLSVEQTSQTSVEVRSLWTSFCKGSLVLFYFEWFNFMNPQCTFGKHIVDFVHAPSYCAYLWLYHRGVLKFDRWSYRLSAR